MGLGSIEGRIIRDGDRLLGSKYAVVFGDDDDRLEQPRSVATPNNRFRRYLC